MNVLHTPTAGRGGDAHDLRSLRRRRSRLLLVRFVIWVFGPTLFASVYLGFVATPQFESVTTFMVQSSDGGAAGVASLLGVILPTGGTGAARDTFAIRDYVHSREVVERLIHDHDWKAHYADPSRDWWSRLPADASSEDVYEYYRDVIHIDYDNESSNLTLTVKAFSAGRAQQFAAAIIGYCEEKVNTLSLRARDDRLDFARKEVEKAEARLSAAKERVTRVQAQESEFNPEQTAAEVFGVRAQLQGELVRARAELAELRAYLQPTTPKVMAARRRISVIQDQIDRANERLIGSPAEDDAAEGLSKTMLNFHSVMMEKEFAQTAYQSAIASQELSRVEATRQHRYLALLAAPSRPDEPTHPKVVLAIATVFLSSLALFGIGTLLVAAVREHARL